MKFFCFPILLLILHSVAGADIIHLKSGGEMEGEIIEKSEGFIKIRLEMGVVRIKEEDVNSIEKREFSLPPFRLYLKEKKSLTERDVNGHYELALYCIKHRLYSEAREELEIVLKLDPSFKDKVNAKIEEIHRNQKSWLYNQALFYSRSRQYKNALAYLDRLLKIYSPEDIQPEAKKLEEEIRRRVSAEELLMGVKLAKNKEGARRKILLMGIREDTASLDVLLQLLKNKDPEIRVIVIEALTVRKDKRALVSLREELANRNALIREKAVRALGELRDETAIESILPLLKDNSSAVRGAAAIALGEIGNEKAVSSLVKALNDRVRDVRLSVVCVLGKMGDKKATKPLVSRLREENLKMRVEIYKALGNIADPNAVKPLLGAMKGELVRGQEQIIAALGKIKTEEAVSGLMKLLKSLQRESLLEKALIALKGIDDERVVPAIAGVLKHPSTRIREKAASTLGMMKDKRALSYLEEALGDPSDSVRIEAAKAIQSSQ